MSTIVNGRQRNVGVRMPLSGVLAAGIEARTLPIGRGGASGLPGTWQAEKRSSQAGSLLQCAMDTLAAQIAIVNRRGDIVGCNEAWSKDARLGGRGRVAALPGTAYTAILGVLDEAAARGASAELSACLAGRTRQFRFGYELCTAEGRQHFSLTGTRVPWNRDAYVVLTNERVGESSGAERLESIALERRLLREDERERIAKELHDSTAQNLVAIGLNLMLLRARGPADDAAAGILEDTERCLAEVLKEVRTITYLLDNPRLQADGLRLATQRFIDGFSARTGLVTRARISRLVDGIPLPAQKSTLRIVQEALSNVHRHAGATQVSVDLRVFSQRMHLAVVDNGRGIKGMVGEVETEAFQPGVGLPGMRARLSELGGSLRVLSQATGTKLLAAIPVSIR